MTAISYWIQHADFSAEDYPPVPCGEAMQAFQGHDWASELRREASRQEQDDESCPPGIGFNDDNGRILHVCPLSDGNALVHYHFDEERSLLGLFRRTVQATRTNPAFPLDEVGTLVERFYGRDHDGLIQQLL